VFEPKAVLSELKGLTGDQIREATIIANTHSGRITGAWADPV